MMHELPGPVHLRLLRRLVSSAFSALERRRSNVLRHLDLEGEGLVLCIALAFFSRDILDDFGRDQIIIAIGRDFAFKGTSTICIPRVQKDPYTQR